MVLPVNLLHKFKSHNIMTSSSSSIDSGFVLFISLFYNCSATFNEVERAFEFLANIVSNAATNKVRVKI